MTATKYPGISDEGGGRFRVRVYDPRTGKQLTRRVEGIAEARRVHARLRAEVQRVDPFARRGTAPSVEDFAESWRVELRHAPLTATSVESTLRLHVYPLLGRYGVDEVAHRVAMRYVREVTESDLAVSTQGRVDNLVRQLFAAVVAEGWLERSPFDRVPRVTVTKRDARRQGEYVPTVAQALDMADMALAEGRVETWAWIRLAVGTGLRGGEVCGLSVDELDYPSPTWLTVDHQVQRSSGRFYLAPPKTTAGERRVPLAPLVAETLAVLSAHRRPFEVTMPWVERGRERGQRTVSLLFCGRYGEPTPLQETVVARAVSSLARRADLPGRVTPHSLRKTYTTMLGDAGVPLRVIDYVTGHESSGLTLGIYSTVTEAGLEQARTATQNALAAVGAATATRAPWTSGLVQSMST